MQELQLILAIIGTIIVQVVLLIPKGIIGVIKVIKSILNIIQVTLESLIKVTQDELIK